MVEWNGVYTFENHLIEFFQFAEIGLGILLIAGLMGRIKRNEMFLDDIRIPHHQFDIQP